MDISPTHPSRTHCPRCGRSTVQDGVWPIEEGDGCLECWERECSRLWWQALRRMEEAHAEQAPPSNSAW